MDGPSKKGRWSGRHQREKGKYPPGGATSSDQGHRRLHVDSELVKHVLRQWAWGQLQATEVQQLCYATFKDQEQLLDELSLSRDNISQSLAKMASLGDWGKYTGNVKRDLLATLGTPSSPEFLLCPAPCVVSKAKGRERIVDVNVPIMAPHLAMAHLYQHKRQRFDQLMFGGDFSAQDLRQFWKTVVDRKDPRIQRHPMCSRPRWASRAIP